MKQSIVYQAFSLTAISTRRQYPVFHSLRLLFFCFSYLFFIYIFLFLCFCISIPPFSFSKPFSWSFRSKSLTWVVHNAPIFNLPGFNIVADLLESSLMLLFLFQDAMILICLYRVALGASLSMVWLSFSSVRKPGPVYRCLVGYILFVCWNIVHNSRRFSHHCSMLCL